jgi:exonuclease SbcC
MGKLSEIDRQIAVMQEKLSLAKKLEASADQFGSEIANWSLISKVFGNDGLIALSIDDCGPEISSLTNQILTDCFGGRFSVRIDTQTETKQGSLKETFEVMVNDCLRGEEKPASLVSGGESVWINESLTRAIALYQAQKSGQSYQTLFSDEADGPLSPEKKRQFIQMKRAVLAIGGYEREFYISQTPELWKMADHIIDVGTL